MSDRICTITQDLSGIRIHDDHGLVNNFPLPIDVARAYALERYRALGFQARINAANEEIARTLGTSTVVTDQVLEKLRGILAGP